jgi:hypothetical protein
MSDRDVNIDKSAAIKAAKPPVFQGCIAYFPRALREVARVSAYGAKKHGFSLADKGFLDPRYTEEMYQDAICRHITDRLIEGEVCSADGNLLHRAQIAWNALASLERFLIQAELEQEKENGV